MKGTNTTESIDYDNLFTELKNDWSEHCNDNVATIYNDMLQQDIEAFSDDDVSKVQDEPFVERTWASEVMAVSVNLEQEKMLGLKHITYTFKKTTNAPFCQHPESLPKSIPNEQTMSFKRKNQHVMEEAVRNLANATEVVTVETEKQHLENESEIRIHKKKRQARLNKSLKNIQPENRLTEGMKDQGKNEEDDENETEITEVTAHRTSTKRKTHTISIVYNTGRKDTTAKIPELVEDAWNPMFAYVEATVSKNEKKDHEFLMIALDELVAQAGSQSNLKRAKELQKKARQHREAVAKQLSKDESFQVNRIAMDCVHEHCNLEEEIHPGVCRDSNKLDGRSCSDCRRKMVSKGKTGANNKETFRPGPMTPAYMCNNIMICGYVICAFCVAKNMLDESNGNGLAKRARRRHK